MKKYDLKSGMILKTRNGRLYLVVGSYGNFTFANEREWCSDFQFNDDLTAKYGFSDLDVMCVYKQHTGTLRGMFDVEEHRLVWKREEVKEVSMKEVCEKFGCQVKIVEG